MISRDDCLYRTNSGFEYYPIVVSIGARQVDKIRNR